MNMSQNKIFYLPHEPIKYDKDSSQLLLVLPYFHTNASDAVHMIFPVRVSEQISFGRYNEKLPPQSVNYIQLVYERKGSPNCEGVSQYVLLEHSKSDLEKHWK